jgi:hypothetical protein
MRLVDDMRGALVLLALLVGACHGAPHQALDLSPGPVPVPDDPDEAVYIVSDATGELAPGEGAGYSITYARGGHWSIRWTCDSALTGYSCLFDGLIAAAVGAEFTNVVPCGEGAGCGAPPEVWLNTSQTDISFSASATTSTDGFDFDAPSGEKVSFDVLIDGWRQIEYVLFPSGDPASGDLYTASPRSLPVVLFPTEP